MSIDQSLKVAGNLVQHRNVLTRAERITRLKKANRFDPASNDPVGLPKVTNKKVVTGKKKKKGPEEEEK